MYELLGHERVGSISRDEEAIYLLSSIRCEQVLYRVLFTPRQNSKISNLSINSHSMNTVRERSFTAGEVS